MQPYGVIRPHPKKQNKVQKFFVTKKQPLKVGVIDPQLPSPQVHKAEQGKYSSSFHVIDRRKNKSVKTQHVLDHKAVRFEEEDEVKKIEERQNSNDWEELQLESKDEEKQNMREKIILQDGDIEELEKQVKNKHLRVYNSPIYELKSFDDDNPQSKTIVPQKVQPLENDEEEIEQEKWHYETGRRVYDSEKVYPEKKPPSNILSSSIDLNENQDEEDIYQVAQLPKLLPIYF